MHWVCNNRFKKEWEKNLYMTPCSSSYTLSLPSADWRRRGRRISTWTPALHHMHQVWNQWSRGKIGRTISTWTLALCVVVKVTIHLLECFKVAGIFQEKLKSSDAFKLRKIKGGCISRVFTNQKWLWMKPSKWMNHSSTKERYSVDSIYYLVSKVVSYFSIVHL